MDHRRQLRAIGLAILAATAVTPVSIGFARVWTIDDDAPEWTPLPGRTRGILVRSAASAMKEKGYFGGDGTYGFASGPGGYRWLYVRCPRPSFKESVEPVTVQAGESGKVEKTYSDVCLLDETLASHIDKRLTRPFTLVDVEINNGLGCPATDSFVATELRVVEGFLDATDAVEEAKKRFLEQVADAEKKGVVTEKFRTWGTEHPSAEPPSAPVKATARVMVTWLPKREVMRIEWRLTYGAAGGRLETSIGTQAKAPGGAGQRRPPAARRPAEVYVVDLAMAFEYGKGNILKRQEPLTIHGELRRQPRAK